MSKTKRIFFTIFHYLEYFFLGFLIGFVIGFYQWIFSYLQKLGFSLVKESYGLFILSLGVFILAIIGFSLHLKDPYFRGNGTTVALKIRYGLLNKAKSRESITYIFWSIIGSFFLLPLGSEGPSVVIGGKTGKLVNDIFHIDDKDNILMAAGCGFGAAFLSPLAGLAYMFEENLHKINIKLFLRGIVMMVPAFIVTSLINHHHLLSISNAEIISFNYYFVFIFLFMIDIIIALAFAKGLIFYVQMFGKYKNKKIIKYRGIIFFVLIFIMSIFLFKLMGSGSQIINNIYSYSGVFLLFGILLLRYLLTVLTGSGKVTGGLVVPLMALGAIGGMIICEISSLLFNLNQEFFPVIVLISMTSTFSYVTMTPLTSTLLAYSVLGYSFSNYLYPLQLIPVLLILNYGGYFLLKYLIKHQCIYPQMCHLIIDDHHNNDKVEKMK